MGCAEAIRQENSVETAPPEPQGLGESAGPLGGLLFVRHFMSRLQRSPALFALHSRPSAWLAYVAPLALSYDCQSEKAKRRFPSGMTNKKMLLLSFIAAIEVWHLRAFAQRE